MPTIGWLFRMASMKHDVWTALLFLPLSLWPLQAAGIRGTIKDELGAVVGQATVIVPASHILSTRTDQNGNYSLELPGEGLYDIFVSATGFAPTCQKIHIAKARWGSFSPRLKVDPLAVKLYGDTFDTKPAARSASQQKTHP